MKKFEITVSHINDFGKPEVCYNGIDLFESKKEAEKFIFECYPNHTKFFIYEIQNYRYSIKINWSENALLNAVGLIGKELPFAVGNAILEELNKKKPKHGGYDKTEYEVTDLEEGGSFTRRYDIGSEGGNVWECMQYSVDYAKRYPNHSLSIANAKCYQYWNDDLIPKLREEDERYISWSAGNKWQMEQYSILIRIAEKF